MNRLTIFGVLILALLSFVWVFASCGDDDDEGGDTVVVVPDDDTDDDDDPWDDDPPAGDDDTSADDDDDDTPPDDDDNDDFDDDDDDVCEYVDEYTWLYNSCGVVFIDGGGNEMTLAETIADCNTCTGECAADFIGADDCDGAIDCMLENCF